MRQIILLIISVLIFTSCQQSTENKAPERPNILFIFTDDHAIQAISAYGSIINETPQMDRLADQGMLFRHATVTNSICGPSRAVILTGKHSHVNGFKRNEGIPFDSTQQTFPKLFQDAGYQTALFGKWHLGSEPTGFDEWKVLPGQGDYYNPDFRTAQGIEHHEGYVTDVVTDMTIDWLDNDWDASQPFLLMSQHKAPHRIWMPALRHLSLYDSVVMPEPPTLFDDYQERTNATKVQEMEIDRHMDLPFDLKVLQAIDSSKLSEYSAYKRGMFERMTPAQKEAWQDVYRPKNEAFLERDLKGKELVQWKYQRYIKDYLKCVKAVDESIGRLLDYLEENNLSENTIVVYSSDQGFYLGEHGWFDKRWMYEESLHTPLIIKWPGKVKSGTESKQLVQNLDYAPTFLEMAGISIPENMQGMSIVPLLSGDSAQWRDAIYYHYYEFPGWHSVNKHFGVRDDRFKLIHYYEIGEWELFDLKEDAQEMHNLYYRPGYAQIIDKMEQKLKSLILQYNDTTATPYIQGI